MIRFAFKIAAEAARQARAEAATSSTSHAKFALLAAALFSDGIASVTGGKFSHVEIWYDGPQSSAWCFAAREPDGTGFRRIDLSDATLWEIVDIPGTPENWGDDSDYAWMQGRAGRAYGFASILDIELGKPLVTLPGADICSQCAFEFLQDRRDKWSGYVHTGMIAPSGDRLLSKGVFGLYDLLKGTQTINA